MAKKLWRRRFLGILTLVLISGLSVVVSLQNQPSANPVAISSVTQKYLASTDPLQELELLKVKGRAPKTGYKRRNFGDGWSSQNGCSTREIILKRDLKNPKIDQKTCKVLSGELTDPYTNKTISFQRGKETSAAVQIDHVVALSDAWQKGAQELSFAKRVELANDPLNLLAVDGAANQQKSDGDSATWLPTNKNFRCEYVIRQVAVKRKYDLWVTPAEKEAIRKIMVDCKNQ